APEMLRFVATRTPIRFELLSEPDPFAEAEGGKSKGRMLSPLPLSPRILGRLGRSIRSSTVTHLFTYQELIDLNPYNRPIAAGIRAFARLLRRWLTGERGQGTALIAGLVRGCLDAGVTFKLDSRATRLVQNADGRITGVELETRGVPVTVGARRGVVIASGGFEWNAELRERHFPGWLDLIGTPRANEGDGQKMAAAAGALLDHMDQANIYPCLPTRYEGQRNGLPAQFQAAAHAIVVNRDAKRFCAEGHYNIGEALDARGPNGEPVNLPCYLIADSRFLGNSRPFRWYSSYEPGWVRKASTIAGLATQLGLPAGELEATVDRWNEFCRLGRDADFARGENTWENYKAGGSFRLRPIDTPPFVGMSFNRSFIGTKGGARTNEHGQVLRPDGSVIPGLYAAGLAMANPFGTRTIGSGTTIGPNMTWGYIAAETIARQAHDE
ncbi:MAG: FAD-binding protein, partial [Hyphomicrobiaceae bacterium]